MSIPAHYGILVTGLRLKTISNKILHLFISIHLFIYFIYYSIHFDLFSYSFEYDFTQCDAKCGAGYQHRQVRCQNLRGGGLPDEKCNAMKRPDHVKRCWKMPCMTTHINNSNSKSVNLHKWRTSNWTPVSFILLFYNFHYLYL